jgi:uncharacterized protein YbcC (UPF0753/DUF2309 family)/NADH:ubiquinone oxidoreductase subunit 5 (subunit L)/multisubunit Na+/H+ antiporter MnhA subunit
VATRSATAVALVVAALTAVLVSVRGPLAGSLPGAGALGFSVRVDGLGAIMLALVAALGAVVVDFSRNYLDGDPRRAVFLGDLALTVACVMLLVMAGSLVQLAVMWSASSLALHRLLLFYPGRPGAVVAARKKFVVARAGDVCLVAASLLLVRAFRTADIGTLAERAAAVAHSGQVPGSVHLAAALIVLSAALKAAQFPGHGWLVEMNETPTPVSALLHAGILNGGTFLVVRLAHVVQLSPLALGLLVVIGGFTAIVSSVTMATEARVKVALGYSSSAHMGFMLLLCGIGAYTVAIVHLVAHSFYKAHAFLSSGSAVDVARASAVPPEEDQGSAGSMLVCLVAAGALVTGVGALVGVSVGASSTSLLLALVLGLGLAQLLNQATRGGFTLAVVRRSALAAAATALSFFALERVGAIAVGGSSPPAAPPAPAIVGLAFAVVAGFVVVSLLQAGPWHRASSRFFSAAYVHVHNGLYANVYFDRLVGAAKLPSSSVDRCLPREASASSPPSPSPSAETVRASVERVTQAHAPVWPLRAFVAVNPYLGMVDRTFAEAAATLARVAGARTTMPREFYLEALESGRIRRRHLDAALAEAALHHGRSALPADTPELLARVRTPAEPSVVEPLPTVADVVGALAGRDWSHVVTERVGAWAATYFDAGQASWRSPWRGEPAYRAWLAEASHDRTPEILGARGFRALVARLPRDADGAIATAIERLAIPASAVDTYLQRLLASIGGWAAYARHQVWDRELRGETDGVVEQLLAVRLAWEVALVEAFRHLGSAEAWARARAALTAPVQTPPDLAVDLVLQAAYEKAWQDDLTGKLPGPGIAIRTDRPSVQAVFCIDVRSEIFRRAFEALDPRHETIGFAGFFGFPLEYVPLGQEGGAAQCPVLLPPAAKVAETVLGESDGEAARVAESRVHRRRASQAWRSFKSGAIACFSFVGPVGLAYAPKLVTDALGLTRPVPHPSRDGIGRAVSQRLGPHLVPRIDHRSRMGLTDEQQVQMAEGLLRGMSLTSGFARLVMLTGHGSTTVNNPHAAGLDCGACGGHTGEANARVAAAVLNDRAVRAGLAERGIFLPDDTVFLGCLHDTTTDEVRIFDRDAVPATHARDLERLEAKLAEAGAHSRRRRAPRLGERDDAVGEAKILARSRDWSQVRPEWGLAGCAAFIVAPRQRTAGVDLAGRSFLHSYDWRADAGFGVLELVMTAPMVVGSWISLQYYASTVDNRVFGCGNKVLHNVVGTVGVLEGNGGDLRTGLPWQSVHDGRNLVHEPLRLNVLIEAPVEAMNGVLVKHPSVRALVDNGWLHLYALGDEGQVTHRYTGGLTWPREGSRMASRSPRASRGAARRDRSPRRPGDVRRLLGERGEQRARGGLPDRVCPANVRRSRATSRRRGVRGDRVRHRLRGCAPSRGLRPRRLPGDRRRRPTGDRSGAPAGSMPGASSRDGAVAPSRARDDARALARRGLARRLPLRPRRPSGRENLRPGARGDGLELRRAGLVSRFGGAVAALGTRHGRGARRLRLHPGRQLRSELLLLHLADRGAR